MDEEAAGQEKAVESDADVCRRDVLAGWVRMDLCPRLRYLIELGALGPLAQVQALGILCQCAAHSLSLATDVARCPHLLPALRGLLEGAATPAVVLESALALLQLLASAGRQIAAGLIEHGLLAACQPIFARGFRLSALAIAPDTPPLGLWGGASTERAGSTWGVEEGYAEEEQRALSGAALGVWRTFAAYALSSPPLDALFPLLSQASQPHCLLND